MNGQRRTALRSSARGAKAGAAIAAICSAIAAISGPARRGSWRSGEEFSLASAVAAYFVVGIIGGAVIGWFRVSAIGRLRRAWLSCFVGGLAGMAFGVTLLGSPFTWSGPVWIAVLLLGCVFSAYAFLSWHNLFED